MSIITKSVGFVFKLMFFLLVAAILGLIGLNFVDVNQYKDDITSAITKTTGINISINGTLEMQIFPHPGVKAKNISAVIGPKDSRMKVSAESIDMAYDFSMFFSKALSLDAFHLNNVDIQSLSDQNVSFQFKYLRGSLEYNDEGIFINQFNGKNENGEFSGTLKYLDDLFPSIVGDLTAPEIKILTASSTKNKSKTLFPTDNVRFDWASKIKLDFHIKTKKMILNDLIMNNVSLKLNSKKDILNVEQSGSIADGTFHANVQVDKIASKSPRADVHFSLKGANAATFLKIFNPQLAVSGGKVMLDFKGQGSAKNIQDFMNHLNGQTLFDVRNIAINGQTTQSLSAGGAIFNILSLQGKSKRQEILECGVAKLNIKNGIARANNSLAVESSSLLAIGSGDVNLKNGSLKLSLTFEPKKGLPFSIGDFDNLAVIGGTIGHPEVKLNTLGTLGEGAALFFGVPTMGLSILAKNLVDIAKIGGSPCKQALSSN